MIIAGVFNWYAVHDRNIDNIVSENDYIYGFYCNYISMVYNILQNYAHVVNGNCTSCIP